METACVVGLGYVGLPLGQLFIAKGYTTYGVDASQHRVDEVRDNYTGFTQISTSFDCVEQADVIVVCVPTPVYPDRTPDLSIINGCLEEIGKHLKPGQLVIIESTVYPGYCNDIAVPILEKNSKLTFGSDVFLAHCPERINPGDKKWNASNIPRVVGGFDSKSLQMATECYRSILDAAVHPMANMTEAEAVKIVENTFRDINIAYVNELAMSFSDVGIDVTNVINGASTKPFGFMPHFPSIGVGGHCIPVDPYYLIDSAKSRGYNHRFLSLAREINNGMVEYLFNKIEHAIVTQHLDREGLKICVLGAAYKPNQSDTRESPGLRFAKYAKDQGVETRMYDPYVSDKSDFSSIEDAIDWSDIVVLATGHDEFKDISLEYLSSHGVKIIVDGQNLLKNTGRDITYIGVGK